ncbi:RDD family protein [Geoalkalibacter halelectricus]|uniref:RDD family protein n=1 Tax=Geoalkalibacter halelectricus TaxID=2847045 RepID=A0ABY5ZR35_9BACT|nr:RDD family protein [Geoalkalibacter halelectricus]MDO3378537.1 RDD family protein [Geoalkalibacter halelectricus]UWZ80149.1 RDD family protein [Geoalkalibacter halelectricus]
MKCPKCGFNSFDYLESCKKCGNDLKEFKGRYNLRSLLFPYREKVTAAAAGLVAPKPQDADFDYGFMDEESGSAAAAAVGGAAAIDAGAGEEDDVFGIDWNQEDGGAEAKAASGAGSVADGDDGFDLDTDSELEDLLQDDGADFAETSRVEATDDVAFEVAAAGEDALEELNFDADSSAVEDLHAELPDLGEVDFPAGEDVELPALDELDFDDLGGESPDSALAQDETQEDTWGEIDFGEEDEKPRKDKAAKAKEEAPDPFDQPEPAAAVQAPELAETPAEADAGAGVPTNPEAPQLLVSEAAAAPLRASLVARLGAFWLDMFLVTGAFLLFLLSATRLLAPPGGTALLPSLPELAALSLPYYLLFFLVCFGYFTAFHFFLGQTPGKMLFGLRLEGSEEQGLLFSEAFLHSVGGLMSLLVLGAGFFLALRDPEGRGWNDRIAGTRLVAVPLEE